MQSKKKTNFLYDKTPYKNVNQDLSFMTPNVNYNHFGSQSQPFTQSQEGFHDFVDRHYHSQFSQTSETNSYSNTTGVLYGEFGKQDDIGNINTYRQDNSFSVEENITNSNSTKNHFNLRMADL